LQAERGPAKSAEAPKVPWLSLFRCRTIWGMMIGFFCLNFVIYLFITWFPTYLVQARGFSVKELAVSIHRGAPRPTQVPSRAGG